MDLNRFDDLARVLSGSDTRRRVLGLVAALPAVGTLLELLSPDETAAKDRRRRRKQRHKTRKSPGGRKKGCTPRSRATVCAGTCGPVTNRQTCGKTVDCGACTCATGCPACQTCNPATGLCDPVANGTACTDGDACTQTDTCQDGVCVGSNPVVCTPLDACHVAGVCNPQTGVCSTPDKCPSPQGCEAGTCCTTAGNAATSGTPCCSALSECADGVCRADCCAGITCTNPPVCRTAVGASCDAGSGTCTYPSEANGIACGTQSTPGGGTTHCCNGACPDPDCLPYGKPCLDVPTCNATCCSATSFRSGGQDYCGRSGANANRPCGSDVDCAFGICQCGICCVASGESVIEFLGCAACCSKACNGTVCA